MIDLHCHLAYGVDDGPKTDVDARALAEALVKAGVTTVACTSHLRQGKGWVNGQSAQEALHGALDEALAGITLNRVRGAEHYLNGAIFDTIEEGQIVPYADSRWFLLEFPYQNRPPNLVQVVARIVAMGHMPVLAHVERYPEVAENDDTLAELVSMGCLIQVNLGSLAGVYARAHTKAAERLVREGWAHIAAGDCHRAADVKPCIIKGRARLKKLVGQAGVDRLTVHNPQRVLDDAAPRAFV